MFKLKFSFFLVCCVSALSWAQVKDTINRFDKSGLKQGKWIRIDEQGNKIYSGTFINDLPTGKFIYYYPNGKIKSITLFYSKSNQAFTQFYNTEGRKISQGKVIGNEKDSTWVFYDANDSVRAIENYRNGKKQGLFLTYYNNGKLLLEKNYENDIPEGSCKEYFDNGKPKAEFTYRGGLYNGKARFYFLSGQLNIEGEYLNDFKEGTWNFYEENGTLDWQVIFKRSNTVKSKRYNGEEDQFYVSKIPKSKINYKNGLRNGAFTEYYDLGEVKVITIPEKDGYPEEQEESIVGQKTKRQGQYLNDKLEGKVTYYKEDGTIEKEETYKEGVMIH
jgi:antitoxin component YwqK of YwqJK toxin-antitoxin module